MDALTRYIGHHPTAAGRAVAVQEATPDPLPDCHVLYIDSRYRTPDGVAPGSPVQGPVLTVSDRRHFAASGGMVELFVEDGRLRFAVNVDAARRAGLHLSSRLLSLATIVREEADAK
jgi:hypothetical protein